MYGYIYKINICLSVYDLAVLDSEMFYFLRIFYLLLF